MPSDRENLILAEVAARARARSSVGQLVLRIREELYSEQKAIFDDQAKRIGVLGTRRAGKTEIWTRRATCTALERPRSLTRIWAINKLRCSELIWEPLKFLCARHKIEASFHDTTKTCRFANGSEIRLLGADKDKEAQKKRGDKTACEIVLEAQGYGAFLKPLVEDVAIPCLFDLDGTFYLEGTPGIVCGGYWYNVSGREDTATRWMSHGGPSPDFEGVGWSMHHLNVLRNPFIEDALGKLAREKAARRWADDNPTYVREWLGRWVNDFDALYYAFDPVRNSFDPNQVQPWGPGWMHTLGWDLGFRDDMALVVWGFHPELPDLYEAFSWKKPGASADEVIEQIKQLEARKFNITRMVADTGGGGRMYVEEVQKRYPYAFEAAKKTEKYEHVRLMNDDLRGGFAKLMMGSPYAQEIAALPKKQPWPDPENPEAPPVEHPQFPNHCCDAGLYAYRGAMHYLHQDTPPPAKRLSPDWWKQEEARILEKLARDRENEAAPWLNRYDSDEFFE